MPYCQIFHLNSLLQHIILPFALSTPSHCPCLGQIGLTKWTAAGSLSPIRNPITLSAIVCWTTAKCHFRTVSTPRQVSPTEDCVENRAKSCLINLSKRKNFDHLSFVKSGPSHIELDGCVAGTQIVTILDYTSVTSVRMLNEKMIWEWPSTNDFVSHVRLGVICNM